MRSCYVLCGKIAREYVTYGGSGTWFILYKASWHKYAVTRIHFIILFGPNLAPASGVQCTVHDTRWCVASQIHHQLNAATVRSRAKGKTPFHSHGQLHIKRLNFSPPSPLPPPPAAGHTTATGRPWEFRLSYVSDLEYSKVKVITWHRQYCS
jgi:hypothetical protein